MSQPLPRSYRLRTTQQFQNIFRNSRRLAKGSVAIFNLDNAINHPRLGIVVPKKYVRKAVQRNQIKRIMRESFRANYCKLPAKDFVLIAYKGAEQCENIKLREQLEWLWKKFIS